MSTPASVVIPAHDEETVIARCLTTLFDGLEPGTQVVVAANGCTDDTVGVATATGLPITVLDLPAPGKVGALREGERAVDGLPRLYLDADIQLTGRAANAVIEALRGDAIAARPPIRFDTSASSWVVRRFYAARSRLRTLMGELCGGGAYGLSAAARARFDEFPDVVADDLFIARIVHAHEVTIVDTDPLVVRVPADTRSLLTIMRRSFRGNREFTRVTNGPSDDPASGLARATTSSNGKDLARQLLRPATVIDAVVYFVIVMLARLLSRRAPATGAWERDHSTRV